MNTEAVTQALHQLCQTSQQKMILVAIASRTDPETGRAKLPIDRICELAACSESGARKAMKILEQDGLLEISRNNGLVNYYRPLFHVDITPALSDAPRPRRDYVLGAR